MAVAGTGCCRVGVTILGPAAAISFRFLKPVMDRATFFVQHTPLWISDSITLNHNRSDFLSRMSEQTDEFIDEYLDVNADACK